MFSWITAPRITNAIEDLRPEANYESTIIDAPETPAHQFAVNAFKHALFGTPAPEASKDGTKQAEKKAKLDAANSKAVDLPAPRQDGTPSSPSKQPGGILMTPGTANRGRKTVSFGSHVVDNEGKRGNIGKSGIPNDCPGKFPSPWTPAVQLDLDVASDKKPRTKLTEALLDARTTTQPKSGQKAKARDDSDITIDLGAPRSESGRYWKEQYQNYAERSEKELKKVIAKQQLAKKFAMKKDGEVTELATKLEQERKRFRKREQELEKQTKDYQERLRQALADSTSANIEVAALKTRIANLEKSIAASSSEVQQSKASFQIYEDSNKEPSHIQPEQGMHPEASFARSFSMASSGKENSSPNPQHKRSQTLPSATSKLDALPKLSAVEGGTSIILGKSSRVPAQSSNATSKTNSESIHATVLSEKPPQPPHSSRKSDMANEKSVPKSPHRVIPSSPLPMPSPDPWLDMHDSSLPQVDKMAMPGYSGQPYSRPEWNPPLRQHRTTKSVSASRVLETSSRERPTNDRGSRGTGKRESRIDYSVVNESLVQNAGTRRQSTVEAVDIKTKAQMPKVGDHKKSESAAQQPSTDQRFDISKVSVHHAEGSSQVKRDRVELPLIDRKEQARRRLEERKKLRKSGS